MRVRFWGVRGSVPTPGPRTVRYGGNTSCVEVQSGSDRLILDSGTGICELGRALVAAGSRVDEKLLITHSHMDHIQGFPFFVPAFISGNHIRVYGPKDFDKGIYDIIRVQMDYSVFPVRVDELAAKVEFHDVRVERFRLDSFVVEALPLNHTILTYGYRVEADGQVMVYAPDHEPYESYFHGVQNSSLSPEDLRREIETRNEKMRRFLHGADLLVLDSQYTPEEISAKVSWGHSTWVHSVDLALECGVKHLVLFHHEPTRDDARLEEVLAQARRRVEEKGGALRVSLAQEGWVCEVAPAIESRQSKVDSR